MAKSVTCAKSPTQTQFTEGAVLAQHQHLLCQDPATGAATKGLCHKKFEAGTWACLHLGSASEFKDKIKKINSFMCVSFERLGYKEYKAIQQEKKITWRILV